MLKSMRVCNRCKVPRDDEDFNANSSRKGGSQDWCRTCTTEYNRQWYEANKEKHRKYVRDHDKRPRKLHTCKMCGKGEPDVEFAIKQVGNRCYRRFICRECEREYRKKFPRGKRKPALNADRAARAAIRRADKNNRAKYIVNDSKRCDKKRGLTGDLDREFVEMLIILPCFYCGDTTLMITLDRIDNSKGHLKSNVVQACYRCNYFRRDMPYDAWMLLVPGLKKARQLGLLDNWHCGIKKLGLVTQLAE